MSGMVIQQLQNPACRLMTLTGLGGVGKTRLALEVAYQARAFFDHGACFVSLVGISSPEFIIPTIADALGFTSRSASDPKSPLFNFLKEKHILLILDNMEHLPAGVDILTELLEAAPNIKILATSREQLNLRAEWAFAVQGLPVPTHIDPARAESNSAVLLFLQRARQAEIDFALKPADLPAIEKICQLVEGLPLGLELAASWVRTLSCQEISQEIEKNIDF
jgi:predicted ATPase